MRAAAAAVRPYGVHIRLYQHLVPAHPFPYGATCCAGETGERGRGAVRRLYLVRPVRRSGGQTHPIISIRCSRIRCGGDRRLLRPAAGLCDTLVIASIDDMITPDRPYIWTQPNGLNSIGLSAGEN